ncbi:MAG: hypothetical protein RQ722_12130 [Desulfuromonadales bacterium]|nr:hypothetical protein [Desulfuromonadales bacterium]
MTSLLDSPHIETLAREESVRGLIVRMTLAQAEHADSQERVLLENALQLLLTRFESMEDDIP